LLERYYVDFVIWLRTVRLIATPKHLSRLEMV